MRVLWMCLSAVLFLASTAEAAYVVKGTKLVDADDVATLPAQEHFNLGKKALDEHNWDEAVSQYRMVTGSFPNSPYAAESYFNLGVAYYNLKELDFANEAFSSYLHAKNNPRLFQEAVEYKCAIADQFAAGARRRFWGTKKLPKWASANNLALKIYDEVIAALPSHEIAARALYSKGSLNWQLKQYRASVEAYQMVIKRFPKNELAPEAYVAISKVYLEQSRYEFQNPDVLAFAQINLRRFKQDFPREERIAEVEADLLAIKEIYANGLYETGQFYERIHKPKAAVIYYHNAIQQFPETKVAGLARQRLDKLKA